MIAAARRPFRGLRAAQNPAYRLARLFSMSYRQSNGCLSWPPTLECHTPNCFSQTVNLDAMGKYFEALGGEALVPQKHFTSLSVCAVPAGRSVFPVTKMACQEVSVWSG